MPNRALTAGNTILFADYTVEIKPHVRARRATLRYNAKKSCFTVTTPKRTSKKFILEFLATHQQWMAQQQRLAPQKSKPLATGTITIQGVPRRIMHHEKPGVAISLQDEELIVHCRAERLPRAILRFLKQHAEHIILPLVRDKAAQINKTVSTIAFRDTTSRWGSCSHDGRLSFSWRLIMAPLDTIDYVVAHEVAHLTHFNHSAEFWALCRALSRNYTGGKHWLKLHGQNLHQVTLG